MKIRSLLLLLFLCICINNVLGQSNIDSTKNSNTYIGEHILKYKKIQFDTLSNSVTSEWIDGKEYLSKYLKYDSIPRLYKVHRIDTCLIRAGQYFLIHVSDLSEVWYFSIISKVESETHFCQNKIQENSLYYLTLYKTDDELVNRTVVGGLPKIVTINNKKLVFYSNTTLYVAVTTNNIKGLCYIPYQ